ncbi:uncharacterized protein LOC135693858 [Rhopilema esculentum]|uniref:uncharacterized protein LOC135693858 n=1 Tax=Rhopilema esculentum TaxID=499914 RepID=UPI0031E0F1F3|eukprot:gene10514-19236_t
MDFDGIQRDEQLAEAVRQYPCLYDKRKKDYKDKNVVANAWRKVAEATGMESGEEAKKLFDNLKKRYSKKRNEMRKVERSGTSTSAVAVAKEKLDQYKFLVWLQPFIQARSSKTNLPPRNVASFPKSPATPSEASEIFEEGTAETFGGDDDDNDDYDDDNGNEISEEGQNIDETSVSEPLGEEVNNDFPARTPAKKFKSRKCEISAVTGKTKWQKKGMDIENMELQFLETVRKAVEEPRTEAQSTVNDSNYHFAMMVYSEINKFTPRNQYIARHQIQNIIFDIQMQEQQQKSFMLQPAWNAPPPDQPVVSALGNTSERNRNVAIEPNQNMFFTQ